MKFIYWVGNTYIKTYLWALFQVSFSFFFNNLFTNAILQNQDSESKVHFYNSRQSLLLLLQIWFFSVSSFSRQNEKKNEFVCTQIHYFHILCWRRSNSIENATTDTICHCKRYCRERETKMIFQIGNTLWKGQ